MYWVIRWTDPQSNEDRAIVVEARSQSAAETFALKRDIPVAYLGPADDADVAMASASKLLWRYSSAAAGLTCFGTPVRSAHVACLALCGLWTIGLLLQSAGVLRSEIPFL